jgi:hypothetical protein
LRVRLEARNQLLPVRCKDLFNRKNAKTFRRT